MIAVDTNILIYAHRRDSPFHERSRLSVEALASGEADWAIAWPCLHEFLAVATNGRVFKPPSTLTEAIDQIDAWQESPSLVMLGETPLHWQKLRGLLLSGQISGPLIHDARIAAICLQHGVRELWSADRDFSRFPSLKVVNPLVA